MLQPRSNSNPGVTSNQKPRNHVGYEVFLMLKISVFPYFFPLAVKKASDAPTSEAHFLCVDHMTCAVTFRDVVTGLIVERGVIIAELFIDP